MEKQMRITVDDMTKVIVATP